jgi:hypothetical protein
VIEDDDVKAFPNMRFQALNPMGEDKTMMQMIQAINQMPESPWSRELKKENPGLRNSHLSTGSPTTN